METPPLPTEQAELMKAEALSADAKRALSRGGLHPTLLGVQSALVAFPIAFFIFFLMGGWGTNWGLPLLVAVGCGMGVSAAFQVRVLKKRLAALEALVKSQAAELRVTKRS
jgi:hypothetical protein